MKATLPSGDLVELDDCYINIEEFGQQIFMKILPDISDSKSANYADEPGIGRSFPFKNYAYSENRTISWTCHFIVCKDGDQQEILENLRALEACTYPMEGDGSAPYWPPPICKIKCGDLLGDEELCCVLKSYSVKFPTEVAWDQLGYIPYKLDVDLSFEVIYVSSDLPGADRIFSEGR